MLGKRFFAISRAHFNRVCIAGVRATWQAFLVVLVCASFLPGAHAAQLVFGSFRSNDNAQNWAQRLTQQLGTPIAVEVYVGSAGARWYRVVSGSDLAPATLDRLARRATAAGVQTWKKLDPQKPGMAAQSTVDAASGAARLPTVDAGSTEDASASSDTTAARVAETDHSIPAVAPRNNPVLPIPRAQPPNPTPQSDPQAAQSGLAAVPTTHGETPSAGLANENDSPLGNIRANATRSSLEWDLGLQTRVFNERGLLGQDRFEASVSAQLDYFRGWDGDRQSLTISPFLRLDSADSERTHFDLREFYYSRVGENWDFHVGARRVFWGVTEFNHLVDIINQTDLVENIDTEDKLGQPMLQLSLIRPWGILDLFALVGARERTLPGDDGRLRVPFPIASRSTYESGAEEYRVDAAIRWSHHIGPVEFGVHHFSGTSRDPVLTPFFDPSGAIVLQPFYPVIDQTGIDAQYFVGDWAFKFEGFSRSGYGLPGDVSRYAAFNAGFERTLVGVLGTRADFGLVVEYMFDERGDEAFNTLFEHDVALGGRLQVNDFADTQALFGVIFDPQNDEYVVSVEASRRLSESWLLSIEGRVFASGERVGSTDLLPVLLDPAFKSAPLQDDDYLQIELKKFL